ncbi:hypothetical protein HanRHA438_Chr15g0712431 [Helianthus annuus]|nr:hypothetical protein HanRHA438_Chr15g0712431 [Helianthus annuus]
MKWWLDIVSLGIMSIEYSVISHENQRGDLNQNHERRKHLTSHSPIIRFGW